MVNKTSPVSIRNSERYFWGNNCEGWHLVKTNELSVIQERMPIGTSEVKHYHSIARQFFYVLSGTAVFEIESSRLTVNQNEGIEIPPQVPHKIINESESELIFLVVSQPKSHGDRTTVEEIK